MKITNLSNYPDAVYNLLLNDDYDAGDSDYTATSLLSPPRQRRLKELHRAEITEDVGDLIYAFWGKMLHKVLEGANRTGLVEKRFFTTRRGLKISAQIDTHDSGLAWDDKVPGLLSDYKLCPIYSIMKPKADWAFQLNLQAWILRQPENNVKVSGLQIIAFAKDHSKVKADADPRYPAAAMARIPIERWSDKILLQRLDERIDMHEAAKKELPLCTDEERFRGFSREHGEVINKNCLFYCSVKQWCEQHKKGVSENEF